MDIKTKTTPTESLLQIVVTSIIRIMLDHNKYFFTHYLYWLYYIIIIA